MGGRHTCHLDSKQRRYISGHICGIMEDFAPLYRRHYCSNLLEHKRSKHKEAGELRPLIRQPDAVPQSGILLEGTLPQYLDGTWRQRHLQVTSSYTVESRDSKEVFKGGWGCKTELVLSGCEICTSVQEHCLLVDIMCKHIKGRSGGEVEVEVFWDCPTAFPVFIQRPYCAPVCLATASHQQQARWTHTLKAAAQHQSSDSLESQAFLEAVSSLKQQRGGCRPGVLPLGSEEEVLVAMVMEEVVPYLQEQLLCRMDVPHSWTRLSWINVVSKVYRLTGAQVKAALADLKEDLSLCHPRLEKDLTAGLQQASLLQDHLAHTITEDMCGLVLQSLLRVIIPRLDRTLQEVATPICDGFASTRRYFLRTCDDVIAKGSKGSSMTEVLRPLNGLGPGEARMWRCLARLEMGSEGQAWLQETWGVHSGTWRPLALRVQNALYRVVDMCVVTFRRLVSRYPCVSLDQSQLSAVLHRLRDRVVKQLDMELTTVRSQLILEFILQLTLSTFRQSVGVQDLSRYEAMVNTDHAPFIHPDIIYHSTLRDSLARHIQSVMRYSLPQQCVPLPASPGPVSSSISSLSEPVYQELLPSGVCLQNCCQTSDGSGSESDAVLGVDKVRG